MAGWIARNTRLRELADAGPRRRSTRDHSTGASTSGRLPVAAAERAERSLVITSALWGALRPGDRIPAYRMRSWSNLVDLGRVEPLWRTVLPDLFAALAGADRRHLRPATAELPGARDADRARRSIGRGPDRPARRHRSADRRRGREADPWSGRPPCLLASGAEPADPDALADVLAEHWPARLAEPERPGRPWTLSLTADD